MDLRGPHRTLKHLVHRAMQRFGLLGVLLFCGRESVVWLSVRTCPHPPGRARVHVYLQRVGMAPLHYGACPASVDRQSERGRCSRLRNAGAADVPDVERALVELHDSPALVLVPQQGDPRQASPLVT